MLSGHLFVVISNIFIVAIIFFSAETTRTGSASVSHKPLENRTDILTVRSSIREYRNKMDEKARGQKHAAFIVTNL